MIYAYMRVSTQDQSIERQEAALQEWELKENTKVDKIFSDKATGKNFDRESYQEMKSVLVPGDMVIIKELDRLGREWELIEKEWKFFLDNDIMVIVLNIPLLSTTKVKIETTMEKLNRILVFQISCALAQTEREKISIRTKEALAVKKAQGVKLGAPTKFDNELIEIIQQAYSEGVSITNLAELAKSSRPTIYTMINDLPEVSKEIKRNYKNNGISILVKYQLLIDNYNNSINKHNSNNISI